jgi:hypothetical protein
MRHKFHLSLPGLLLYLTTILELVKLIKSVLFIVSHRSVWQLLVTPNCCQITSSIFISNDYSSSVLNGSNVTQSLLYTKAFLNSFRNLPIFFFQFCNVGTAKLISCVIYSSINNQLSFKNGSCISGPLYISEIHEPHFILHYIRCIFLFIHLSSHHSGSKDSIESTLQKHSLSYNTDRYTNHISCTVSNDRILIKYESGTACTIVQVIRWL